MHNIFSTISKVKKVPRTYITIQEMIKEIKVSVEHPFTDHLQ